jgi:hypothetical protein
VKLSRVVKLSMAVPQKRLNMAPSAVYGFSRLSQGIVGNTGPVFSAFVLVASVVVVEVGSVETFTVDRVSAVEVDRETASVTSKLVAAAVTDDIR